MDHQTKIQIICWSSLILLFAGVPLAGQGTWAWTSAAIEPTSGSVERQWDVPDGSGMGVRCVTLLRMAASLDVEVNVTVAGPCMGVPIGSVVPLCMPRGKPDCAVVECEMPLVAALAILVSGWAIVGASAATLVVMSYYCRRRGGRTTSVCQLPTTSSTNQLPITDEGDGEREFRREDSDSLLLPVNIGVPLMAPSPLRCQTTHPRSQ